MKRIPLSSGLFIVAIVFWLPAAVAAANVGSYQGTIDVFRSSPSVEKFFNNSYGYAVFPTIAKAGYVIGGSYGKGLVYRHGKVTGKSKVFEGSIGFQIGGEAFSEIIFFQDKRAYDEFTSGNFEFGAGAQAVVVTAGAETQAGTSGTNAGASAGPKTGVQAETNYVRGMATFVHAQGGLMVGFTIGGEKFTFTPLHDLRGK
jgi:lipid-binding SYLF domain-containing protein